ncbi:MAG TPA: hypothetical protein VKG05_02295 [Steroidobacteraceae bacterium]|nr:hypothetical protein [Steroidobacteraceae bacterium]
MADGLTAVCFSNPRRASLATLPWAALKAPSMDPNRALASKLPIANSQPPFYDEFSILPPGTYSLECSCEATLDNSDQADTAVMHVRVKTGISVVSRQTTTVDIP